VLRDDDRVRYRHLIVGLNDSVRRETGNASSRKKNYARHPC